MKQRLYKLLMVEHRVLLDACYRQVFFADGASAPIKTFDDCLSDFYLYLLDKAERQLPQYAEIIAMRQDKRKSIALLQHCFEDEMERTIGSVPFIHSMAPSMAEELFAPCEGMAESSATSSRPQNRIVRLFKEFIGLK